MRNKLIALIGFIGFITLLIPSLGLATIIIKLSDKEMTKKASSIIRGKVIRRYSKWDSKKKRIYTYTKIAILEPIKGKKETQEVVIRQLGGSVGNIGMKVSGNASFKLGEEVLVFLEKIVNNKLHQYHVMGMAYGKYRIVEDANKRHYLVRDLSNLSIASLKKGRYQFKAAHTIKKSPLYLDHFVKKIRTYIAEIKRASLLIKQQQIKTKTPPK